jgi:small subunit ribosomal protein S13
MSKEEDVKGIVRIAGKDLNGNLSIPIGLQDIKGVGYRLAHTIAILFEKRTGVNRNKKIGALDDKNLKELEATIKSIEKEVVTFMINRRKDISTGQDKHLIGSDLIFQMREDIKNMQKVSSYRGIRHGLGLTVRGQRTRTTGRKNKTMGVKRKKR